MSSLQSISALILQQPDWFPFSAQFCYRYTICLRKTKVQKAKYWLRLSGSISHIEKNWKNQASSFYHKKLNKVHHGTAYKDKYEIPIPLLIRNDSLFFNYENFIRVCHMYIKVWSLLLGQCLSGKKEPSNGVDQNAVTVIHLHSCGREGVVYIYYIYIYYIYILYIIYIYVQLV